MYLAMIVVCLASFRNLFSRKTSRQPVKRDEPARSSNLFLRGNRHRNRMRSMIDTLATTSDDIYLGNQVQTDGGHDRLMFDHRDDSHDSAMYDSCDLKLVDARVTGDDDLVEKPSRVLHPSAKAAHVKENADIHESAQV